MNLFAVPIWLAAASCLAADFVVPSGNNQTILTAYSNAVAGVTNTISVQPRLYLEGGPFVLDGSKHVILQSISGRFVIAATNPPPNDDFTNRTALSGLFVSTSGFNYSASLNPVDPVPHPPGANLGHVGRTLWYSWTAPTHGLFYVNTVGSDADFHPLLDVFIGDAYPPARLNEGEVKWRLENEVGFDARQGVDYAFLVGGYDGSTGRIVLNISYALPPANDQLTNAFVLASDSLEVRGTIIGATAEVGEPDHADNAANNSVWFRWTAPTDDGVPNRPVTFSTAGSDFDTVLAVYTGTNIGNLTLIASNDNRADGDLESQVTFPATNGVTYWIALDGARDAPQLRRRLGNYRLMLDHSRLNLEPSVSPAPSAPGTARPFSVRFTVHNYGDAPTDRLRVRLAARFGASQAAVHLAPSNNDMGLGVFDLPLSRGMFTNETGHVPPLPNLITTNCPAPFAESGRTNLWGVFALLEERFSGVWTTVDTAFLLYGNPLHEGGEPDLSYGFGRPIPSALTALGTNTIGATKILLTNYVTDLSSNQFTMLAQLRSTGELRAVTNATWSAARNVLLSTNGVLRVLELTQSTIITVTGRFNFGGLTYRKPDDIPIYRRPTLLVQPLTGIAPFRLTLLGETNIRYSIEWTSDFQGTGTVWTPLLGTNRVPGPAFTTNLPVADRQRFYRVNRLTP